MGMTGKKKGRRQSKEKTVNEKNEESDDYNHDEDDLRHSCDEEDLTEAYDEDDLTETYDGDDLTYTCDTEGLTHKWMTILKFVVRMTSYTPLTNDNLELFTQFMMTKNITFLANEMAPHILGHFFFGNF